MLVVKSPMKKKQKRKLTKTAKKSRMKEMTNVLLSARGSTIKEMLARRQKRKRKVLFLPLLNRVPLTQAREFNLLCRIKEMHVPPIRSLAFAASVNGKTPTKSLLQKETKEVKEVNLDHLRSPLLLLNVRRSEQLFDFSDNLLN